MKTIRTAESLPVAPRVAIGRPRLEKRLSATKCRVTTVIAPAGYGKTTLVTEVLASIRDRSSCAYVALQEADDDPIHFWATIARCGRVLDTAAPNRNADARQGGVGRLGCREDVLRALECASFEGTLVLDDVHLVNSAAGTDALSCLVSHLPPKLHLVLCSRADLADLPLHRLRLCGELDEIGTRDLAFLDAEAAELLQARCPGRLGVAQVDTLVQRTEGWAVGLEYAASAVSSVISVADTDADGCIADFSGRSRGVAQYLLHEVLSEKVADIQQFLLETSILDVLDATACKAVTGRPDSADVLRRLHAAGAFVEARGDGRGEYRYQGLFASFLRGQLEAASSDHPRRIERIHRAASVWFESVGDNITAVEHSLASADYERAAGLIVGVGDEMHRRRLDHILQRWFAVLPTGVVADRTALGLKRAWSHAYAGELTEALLWCEKVDAGAAEAEDTLADSACLRAFCYRTLGNLTATVEWGSRAFALLNGREPEHRHHDAYARLAMTDAVAEAYGLLGQPERAIEVLKDNETRTVEGGNVFAAVALPGLVAALSCTVGQLHVAADYVERSIEAAKRLGLVGQPPTADAEVALAELLWESDDLTGSETHYRAAIDACSGSRRSWINLRACRGLAACLASQRREDEGRAVLDAASDVYPWGIPPDFLRIQLVEQRIHLAIRTHDRQALPPLRRELLARGAAPDLVGYLDTEVLLASGEVETAYNSARHRVGAASRNAGIRESIMANVQLARAAQVTGRTDEAIVAWATAVSLGEAEGFLRTVVEPAAGILASSLKQLSDGVAGFAAPSPAYLRQLDAAARREQGRVLDNRSRRRREPLAEPLSDGELAVIPYLPTAGTYAEIAANRFVSVNTVKSQLKSVYRKLGVSSQVSAVERCRELGLLG